MYKNKDRYYKILKPVGSWDREGCEHYVLWQRVWKWWFPWSIGQSFWLDMCGFEKTKWGKIIDVNKEFVKKLLKEKGPIMICGEIETDFTIRLDDIIEDIG